MEELSRSTEYSETTLLVSKPQQNRLIRRLKIWTLGVGSIAVSVATAFPVAIINNWKKSGTLSFKNGIDDLTQNPPLLIVPEVSTLFLTTGAYIAIKNLIDDFVDKKFSKDIKIKNLILNLTLIATNEIVKKINEKLTTSVLVNTDIFDDLFVTVVLSFSAEVAVVIMWKIFEIWKKYIEGFDFYNIGIPILST